MTPRVLDPVPFLQKTLSAEEGDDLGLGPRTCCSSIKIIPASGVFPQFEVPGFCLAREREQGKATGAGLSALRALVPSALKERTKKTLTLTPNLSREVRNISDVFYFTPGLSFSGVKLPVPMVVLESLREKVI